MGFTFNGIRKDYVELLTAKPDRLAPLQRQLFEVPGLPGARLSRTKTMVRRIKVLIDIDSGTHGELLSLIEDLNEWLIHDTPKELIFDSEPNRRYFAVVEGGIEDSLLSTYGQFIIEFICPDPYKYGPSNSFDFVGGSVTLMNNGTVPASPIFEVGVLSDITYLDIFNNSDYMRVGSPVDPGAPAPERMTRVLNDEMIDLSTWVDTGLAPTGDTVAGNFVNFGGYETKVGSFGTGTGWHGPALKRSIPEAPINDFQVELQFKFPSPGSTYFGRTELYLLDDQSEIIGKITMEKIKGGSTGNRVKVQMGGPSANKLIIDYTGDTGREWDNFQGIIRLIRVGNVWESYVAQVTSSTGVHHSRHYKRYTDSSNLYVGNLSQLQLHMAQYGTSPAPDMRISGIHVNRFNDVSVDSPFIIATAGDTITFDHKNSELLINGEDSKYLKDFGASFFKLPKGSNTITIEPSDQVTASVIIEEAYL